MSSETPSLPVTISTKSSTDAATSTLTTTTINNKQELLENNRPGSWTKYLPESFGIRENIQNSPFRFCVRESFMWGIATGTCMGLHRLRMNSHPFFALNVAFGTSMLVTVPSYYFCFKRREHKEKMIEMMMKANDFEHQENMPEPVPREQHPFIDIDENTRNKSVKSIGDKEFVGSLKERKEWQKGPSNEERELSHVFKEVKK